MMTTTSTADNLYAIELIIEIDRGKYKTLFPAPHPPAAGKQLVRKS